MLKTLSLSLCENATVIEADQFDVKHFYRVRGQMHSDAKNYMNQMCDYTRKTDSLCNKYFHICQQINELVRMRECILDKAKGNSPIEKPDIPVKCKSEAKEASE